MALTITTGIPNFSANAVNFDGSVDYITRGAGLSGAADSKLWTFSFWVKKANLSSTRFFCNGPTVGGQFDFVSVGLTFEGDGSTVCSLRVYGGNSAGTKILEINSTSNAIASGEWKHVLVSVDMADTAKRHIYVNGTNVIGTITTYTNDTLDFTEADWALGADPGGNFKTSVDVAEFWFAPGVYMDFSQLVNRRAFVTAAGKPAYLGPTGNYPTGTAPLIYLSGDTATWHTNDATGGGFTKAGSTALTTSTSSPSDDVPLQLNGLIAWYKADTGVYSDAGTTLATTGQTVQQWNDQSGNGRNLSQATSGNRPTYQSTGLNSRQTVRFTPDANRRCLLSGVNALAVGGTTVSAFAVAKINSPPTNDNGRILSYATLPGNDSSSAGNWTLQRATNVESFSSYRLGLISVTTMTYATATRFGIIFNGTNGTCYKNNVAGTSTGSTGTFLASGYLGVGASVDGVDGWLDGDISEIVITSTALSSTERTQLDSYFQSKWGF